MTLFVLLLAAFANIVVAEQASADRSNALLVQSGIPKP